jgi:hypothetical protein
MKISRQVHKHYIRDLGCMVKKAALDAKRSKDEATGRADYELGRLMAFHEMVSLMQQQALAFGLAVEEICLEDIDPERDLL